MRRLTILIVVAVSLALLAGCSMVVDPNFQPQPSSGQIEPEAGQWQTWVLTSLDEVRPAPPPDQAATMAETTELKTLVCTRRCPGTGANCLLGCRFAFLPLD